MTLRTRRKIFAFFILLFLVISIGVIYYTKGYRFDFQTGKMTQTGSLYIESYDSPVVIYLNDERYEDKSGLLKKGTLISSILPKKYRLKIEKDGFLLYEKNIEIKPSQVTRLFYVDLISKDLAPIGVYNSTSTSLIIDTNESGELLLKQSNKSYGIFDPSKSQDIKPIQSYIASLTKNPFSEFRLRRDSTNSILAMRNNMLYSVDMNNDKITQLVFEKFPKYFLEEKYFFGIGDPITATSSTKLSTTTPIHVFDIKSGSSVENFIAPFESKDIVEMDGNDSRYVFLISNGDVWVRQNKEFEKIAHDAKRALLSPDGYKILFQDSGGPVFMYTMRDEYEALDMQSKSTIKIQLSKVKSIKEIQWSEDSYHIFIGYPDSIVFAEITKIEPNNQIILRKNGYDSFIYNRYTQELYVLQNKIIELFKL